MLGVVTPATSCDLELLSIVVVPAILLSHEQNVWRGARRVIPRLDH